MNGKTGAQTTPVHAVRESVSCETPEPIRVEPMQRPSCRQHSWPIGALMAALGVHALLLCPWPAPSMPPTAHAGIESGAVRLYTLPAPSQPAPSPTVNVSPAPEEVTAPPVPVDTQPTPTPPSASPEKPRTKSPQRPAARHAEKSAPPGTPSSAPARKKSAGEMLEGGISELNRSGWAQTSDQFAVDNAPGVESALAQYRQEWVKGVQRYADAHFPKTTFEGVLTLNVTVARDGQLVSLNVLHSTGNAALDAQAMQVIRAAAPFRAFDASMGNRRNFSFQQRWIFNRGALFELQ